ncbi:MAG: glycosyltransferase family 39 protein [Phycisphaerales bacterium]
MSTMHVETTASVWTISRRWSLVALVAAMALVWCSPFDHPLYPPDEGRYGTVAATMAETGNWIVPMLNDRPHLTKPPLTYWLQGLGILVFGRSEEAVRLPSLVCTSAVILTIFLAMNAIRGRVAATCAVLLYAIMPEAMIVGRLGSTDAILNLWWTLSLVCGYFAVTNGRARWALGFWIAIGLAAFTKGPAAVGPVAIIVAWRFLAGDLRSLLSLRPWWGIPLSLAPSAAWALAVVMHEPALWQTWWRESMGRVTGELGKRDVWWYYIPIFLLGMFPASAMMTLPWFNMTWREAWRRVRDGSFEAMCVMAVVMPLVGFSVSSGKLPTYLLPVAAPLAMSVGAMLAARWVVPAGAAEGKPPDVRITLLACCALAAIVFPIAAIVSRSEDAVRAMSFVFVIPLVGAAWLALRWHDPVRRRRALVVAWLAFAVTWGVAFASEDNVLEEQSPRRLVAAIDRVAGDDGEVFVVARPNATWHFYRKGAVRDLGNELEPEEIRLALRTAKGGIFGSAEWDAVKRTRPELVEMLEPVEEARGFFNRDYVICRVRQNASSHS